ncbi:MAG: ECF transporter S component [Lachnospiraceae bacterium]
MSETTMTQTTGKTSAKKMDIRKLTGTAMLSAIAYALMFLDFSVPFMPSFIKMDLSELPALIGSFAYGPIAGVVICLIKNLIHLTISSTGGVGELSNFLLGASFVLVAGFIYKWKKTRKGALIGSIAGALVMAVFSIFSNYFLVYPIYYNFMPKDAILAAYQVIFSGVDNILECLIVFNAPFTFVKGIFSVIITFLIYKRLSPILKGTQS